MHKLRLAKQFSRYYDDCITKEKSTNKCRDQWKISLISHIGKIVARILRTRLGSKIVGFIEDQFGFREGKDIRDAIGLMGIISGRVHDNKEEICLCFVD